MKEGATAEVIENHPMAKANVARSLTKYARRQAGTDRSGPSRRNGVRTRTRSDIQPRTTVAIPAAREKREKSNQIGRASCRERVEISVSAGESQERQQNKQEETCGELRTSRH